MKRANKLKTIFENEHLVYDLNTMDLIKINDQTLTIFGKSAIRSLQTFNDFIAYIDSVICDSETVITRSLNYKGDQIYNYLVKVNNRKIYLKEISWVDFSTTTFHIVFCVERQKYFDLSYAALFEIVQKTETPAILLNNSLSQVLSINAATLLVLHDQFSELVSGFSISSFFVDEHDFEKIIDWIQESDSSMLNMEAKLLLGEVGGNWFHLTIYRVNPIDETLFLAILEDITPQKKFEMQLRRSNELLTRVVEVQGNFLAKSIDSNPYELLLSNILKVIDAEIGFVGKVILDSNGKQVLRIHAASDISDRSKASFNLYQNHIRNDYLFRHLDNLFGACILEAKIILANNPPQNPHYKGVELAGHPRIQNFLGVPILKGNEVIGLVGLGNKAGGFSDEDVVELSPFISTYSLIIEAIRFENDKIQYEKESQVKAKILSKIADHSPDLIVVMNKDSNFEFISSAALHFFDNEMGEEEVESIIRNILYKTISPQFKIGEGKYRSTLPIKNKKFDDYWVESNVNILDEQNDPKVMAVIRDVSLQKDFENRLIKSLEEERQFKSFVSDFINVISHEFKTPLTTILSSMELTNYYLKELDENEEVEKLKIHYNRMGTEIENLFELVSQSLDYDRFQAKMPVLKKENVRFAEFVKSILLSKGYFNKVLFSSDIDGEFLANIDRFLIETSIINLVSNAIKYGKGKKRPLIHLFQTNTKIGIRVIDYGEGIPENELPYIFTPFYRGSNSSGKEGSGFGLVAVKNFIALHEGEIDIQSIVGKGTQAVILLKKC